MKNAARPPINPAIKMAHKEPSALEAVLLETKTEATELELVSTTRPAAKELSGETLWEAITTSEPATSGTSNSTSAGGRQR